MSIVINFYLDCWQILWLVHLLLFLVRFHCFSFNLCFVLCEYTYIGDERCEYIYISERCDRILQLSCFTMVLIRWVILCMGLESAAVAVTIFFLDWVTGAWVMIVITMTAMMKNDHISVVLDFLIKYITTPYKKYLPKWHSRHPCHHQLA